MTYNPPVPSWLTAVGIVTSIKGENGKVLQLICHTGKSFNQLKREGIAKMQAITIHRAVKRAQKGKSRFTLLGIRVAAARRIALEKGFLAAHEALGCEKPERTKMLLGAAVIKRLIR